jgi:translocation and assembly module TamA
MHQERSGSRGDAPERCLSVRLPDRASPATPVVACAPCDTTRLPERHPGAGTADTSRHPPPPRGPPAIPTRSRAPFRQRPGPAAALRRIAALALWALAATAGAEGTLTLRGLSDADARWVRDNLSVPDCLARGWAAGRLSDALRSRIEARRRSVGDYRPEIRIRRTIEGSCVALLADVVPGPEARVASRRIAIEGEGAERLRAQLSPSDLAVGGPFREAAYEALKSRLLGSALDTGHFDARYETARVTVRPRGGPDGAPAADVELLLRTGPRFTIRRIRIDVNGPRPPEDRLRRYLHIRPGDPWDPEALDRTRRSLLGSGYAASLVLRPETPGSVRRPGSRDASTASPGTTGPAQVDLVIEVEPVTRYEVTGGVGYATDTGPGVNGAFADRLAGPGTHRWEVRGEFAQRERSAAFVYGLPGRDPDTLWGFETGGGRTVTDTSDETRWGAGVRRRTNLGERLTRTLHLELTGSDFAIGEEPTRFATFLVAGIHWELDRTDDAERLPAGLRASLDLSVASASLLSDADLLHARARIERAWRLGERTRLRTRLDGGALSTSDFEALPPTWRFFAGGDDSVRGFDREALGPAVDGTIRGGEYLLTGTVELERVLWRNWGGAAFVDSGNAFDGDDSPAPETAVGVGVRWYSPIGAIRADVAHPVDGGSVRLHLTLGRSF